MPFPSDTPIQFVKGVGPARAKLFANLGVHTAEDLLYLFPNRYEDRARWTPIKNLKAGSWQTVAGKVITGGGRKTWFTQKRILEIVIGDEGGRIFCVWFNQPYLSNYFKVGQEVVLYGKVDFFKNRLQLIAPEFELIAPQDRSLNMGRIVPIYPLTKGITQRYLRKIMDACLRSHGEQLRDVIPETVRKIQRLAPLAQSIRQIHFPSSSADQQQANDRIAFEEFFLFQISVILRRLSIVQKDGIAHHIGERLISEYMQALPFGLTGAQKKVLADIAADMAKDRPMLRLVQGDVGSGKTVAAFFGCIAAWHSGHQAALMAPTEILARQHYENFREILGQGPFKSIKTALLISSLTKKEKDALYAGLKQGTIDLIIGTHALLEETVTFKDLSFVVIDEQHKFGVQQRALLSAKGGGNPDVLIMTATPIPRTLCLTLYGDLEVSVINEMPPGRGKVSTYHFPSEKAPAAYEKVRQWVKKGTQAYIIYPMIGESEKVDLKTAKEMFGHFQKHEFTGLRLALAHGQMDRRDIDDIMLKFKRHELDILVATTILEVGIDVSNANVMVIEHA
ncbi:MAG: ATP-dependent DNA helicase RecG, partial [Candidatus Omnitrophica bacterium]|nr:ATP-dependent DNA helicase RecG [Candidatus Omnitrophota bacterium]